MRTGSGAADGDEVFRVDTRFSETAGWRVGGYDGVKGGGLPRG